MKVVLKELKKALSFQENNKDTLRISLEEIKQSTKNFNEDNCIGGGGSFGKVYKGKVPQGDGFNTIVAKRLDTRLGQVEHHFLNELQILLEYKDDQVISLVGYCDENDEKVIVYEYASGCLDRYLNDASLTWIKRLNICIDVACALVFLHGGVGRQAKVIIHRDIKTANILLNDDWKAKLAGFGLSLISPLNQDTDYVIDYILCGRSTFAIYKHEGQFLPEFIRNKFEAGRHYEVMFEQMKEQIMPKSLTTFQAVAYQCLHHEREKRPTAKDVLMQLKKALEFQVERVQCSNADQVANKLEKLTCKIHKLEHLKIHLSDIKLATNNFSETSKITIGTYFTWYRGELGHFNEENSSFEEENNKGELSKKRTTVVIKRTRHIDEGQEEERFYREIEMLSSVKHRNIVTLLGFCVEGSEMILVIENVSNGYLYDYLGNVNDTRRILTWEKRLQICIDVAQALNYLHFEMEDQNMIINRSINSYNIGLDENWGAKIDEFGSSVFLPPNQEEEALYLNPVDGKKYYKDPEFEKTGKIQRKSDVYSFGVVLFEILCGRIAYDPIYTKESDKGLASIARRSFSTGTLDEMIDHILKEETDENGFVLNRGPNKDSLHTFIEIAFQCVTKTQNRRPTMKVVLKELEKALRFQKNNKDNPRISLEDINQATQNFHNDNCIGRGGFGKVYKGKFQDGDGFKTIIVAKRLDTRLGQGEHQFLSELQILLEYKHENVIGLVGYCDEKDEKIIVYEYASKGSLDRYLNHASLTWMKRLNICIDIAIALDFLHGGVGKQAKVIHRDIKTANILLHHNWKAKLADFGLSLISSINQKTNYVIDHACGTPGYVDPLYKKTGFLTIESDIYSFGVVLFEILYGRSMFSIHKHGGEFLSGFIKNVSEEGKHDEMVFEQIKEQIVPESLTTFQEIAYIMKEKTTDNKRSFIAT